MKHFLWTILGCIISLSAYANDSIARIGAGGIIFLKSEDIRLVQEILEISPSNITVHYRFLNESDKDIRATLAFPMPPYLIRNPQEEDSNNGPLRPFSTTVNGIAVKATLIRKATADGSDITDKLRKVGLTDEQIFETSALCPEGSQSEYCGVTPQQQQMMEGMRLPGEWWVDETAVWEYVFPAHKEVEVKHVYQPRTGTSYSKPYQAGGKFILPVETKEGMAEACVDKDVAKAIDKRIRTVVDEGARDVALSKADVSYILLSGKNWKGPITDFRLRLKKAWPDQIVSVCFPGKPRRVEDGVLEFAQKDFVPQDDLVVYFYTVSK
ncbi:hypothetical protein GALL_235990 [mine drainage metagenome]|uniref:DUF4424 domain-containing protein n=1 Tax=mine drainage metagenome TaxID=410659 RepID=A0A1J5RY90_9ZZZZ